MPTVTVRKKGAGKAGSAKGKAGKPAKAKATKAASTTTSKPRADITKQRAEVKKMVKQGTKMGEIADALGVSAGRAKYLDMLNQVEAGTVASISTSGNDDAIAKRIVAARNKQDEHSSWGWISARTGISEVRVKTLAEEAGLKVKGSHVAKERAAARPAKAKASKAGKGKRAAADPS